MNIYKKIGVACVFVMGMLFSSVIIGCEFFNGLGVMSKVAPLVIAVVVVVVIIAMALDFVTDKD